MSGNKSATMNGWWIFTATKRKLVTSRRLTIKSFHTSRMTLTISVLHNQTQVFYLPRFRVRRNRTTCTVRNPQHAREFHRICSQKWVRRTTYTKAKRYETHGDLSWVKPSTTNNKGGEYAYHCNRYPYIFGQHQHYHERALGTFTLCPSTLHYGSNYYNTSLPR